MKKIFLHQSSPPALKCCNTVIYSIYFKSIWIFAIVLLIFSSCQKDYTSSDNESKIGFRSDYIGSTQMIDDYYNAFISKKNLNVSSSKSALSPYYYNIIKSSSYVSQYFGDTALIVKTDFVLPKDCPNYVSNQILIKRNKQGQYSISNLIYLADSAFYAQKKYKPLLINFTGYILEIDENAEFSNIYKCDFGEITNKLTISEVIDISRSISDGIQLRWALPDWLEELLRKLGLRDPCPTFGSSHSHSSGITDAFEDLWEWLKRIFAEREVPTGDWNGDIFVPNFAIDVIIRAVYQGGGSGGDPFYNPNECNNTIKFIKTMGKPTYINYIEALSTLKDKYGLSICDDIFNTNESCEISYQDLLCSAVLAGCFPNGVTSYVTENEFENCMDVYISNLSDFFNNTGSSNNCQAAIDNFNQTYGTSFTTNDLVDVFDAGPNICANQEVFNNQVMLFILSTKLDLTNEQTQWLDIHDDVLQTIFSFYISNQFNDIRDFLNIALETYIDGSEFNLENYERFQGFIPEYKSHMTAQEIVIFESMTKAKQLRFLYNAQTASDKAKELFPGIQHNTKADAFRHAYFHGLNTYYIGYDISQQLGDAHESETPPEYELEKAMDLYNNQEGRYFAQNPHIYMNGYGVVELRIYDAVINGYLLYIQPLDSDGNILQNSIIIWTNQ